MKTVLSTLIIIGLAVLIAVKFFFSSILAMFGYAALPIDNLAKLTHSQKVVQTMQKRNKMKSDSVSKRFIKRSGKKVAATAVSAATIGTVAVIGTLTYMEVSQYCDEKRVLNEEANILFDTKNEFDMPACLEQGKKESAELANEAWQSIKNSSDDMLESLEKSSDELLDPSRKATVELFESMDKWFHQYF